MRKIKKMVVATCVLPVLMAAAGVRVEIDPAVKGDRTVQIAASEFRKFYTQLTGQAAAGERRILLKVDPVKSADGYDAFALKSDEKGAVLTGGNARSVLYAVYELLEKRGGGTAISCRASPSWTSRIWTATRRAASSTVRRDILRIEG